VGRRLARGGVGDLPVDADTAEGDGGQHEHDEKTLKLAQGEVPFVARVCGRAGTLSRRPGPRQLPPPISLRLRTGSSGIRREYFVRNG
jgi:hypothetical protein